MQQRIAAKRTHTILTDFFIIFYPQALRIPFRGAQAHGKGQKAQRRIVGSHAGVIRPAPKPDEPVQHQHQIREEEQHAGQCDGSIYKASISDEVAQRLTQHGGDDQCVDDANHAENRHVKVEERAEQEEQETPEEQDSADGEIQSLHSLREAVGDDEADVAERKGGGADDEIVADQHVSEERKHKTGRHAHVEPFAILLGYEGVAEIDQSEGGK